MESSAGVLTDSKGGGGRGRGLGCFSGVSGAQRLWLHAVLLGEDLGFI